MLQKASSSKAETCIKMGSEKQKCSLLAGILIPRPALPMHCLSSMAQKMPCSLNFLYRTSFSSHPVSLSFGYLRITGGIEPQFPTVGKFLVANPKLVKVLTVSSLSAGAIPQPTSLPVSVPATYRHSVNQY